MGCPKDYPVYWDKILVNASQVTNPFYRSTARAYGDKGFFGSKPQMVRKDENGRLITKTEPCLELSIPIMFSAISYGSISYNAHESLARAAKELGTYYNTGEGGCMRRFTHMGKILLFR